MLYGLTLPPYSQVSHLNGRGNYAVDKYYKLPHSLIYQYKIKMVRDLLKPDHIYRNLMDFGGGPGILLPELKKHALRVFSYEKGEPISPYWNFEAIVCASVLEFCPLETTIKMLAGFLKKGGDIIIVSPMTSRASSLYFKMIGDKNIRNTHIDITNAVSKHFKIVERTNLFSLYFGLRATTK